MINGLNSFSINIPGLPDSKTTPILLRRKSISFIDAGLPLFHFSEANKLRVTSKIYYVKRNGIIGSHANFHATGISC